MEQLVKEEDRLRKQRIFQLQRVLHQAPVRRAWDMTTLRAATVRADSIIVVNFTLTTAMLQEQDLPEFHLDTKISRDGRYAELPISVDYAFFQKT